MLYYATKACYETSVTSKPPLRVNESRIDKHRRTHKLVQTWVSPEMWKALVVRAKEEGRTLANLARRELGKIVGIAE